MGAGFGRSRFSGAIPGDATSEGAVGSASSRSMRMTKRVLPARISSPLARVASLTRAPLRNVPLLLLRSRKRQPFSRNLDSEVETRHLFVVGKGVVGFRGAADTERFARDQANLGAFVRIGASLEKDLHLLSNTNSHACATGQGRMQLARFPTAFLRASPHLDQKHCELPNGEPR